MSMTVARRNRRWTPELVDKLRSDVDSHCKNGYTREVAFRLMSAQWGMTPQGLSSRYYAKFRTARTKVAPTPSLVGNTAPMRSMEEAIEVLKKLGVKVTLTF